MATNPRTTARSGVTSSLRKLQNRLESGNYYEAHQLYKTLSFRYMSQKKYKEAIELVYNGAKMLLKYKQIDSGADLSMMFLNYLKDTESPINIETVDKIADLYKGLSTESVFRTTLTSAAIKWSTQVSPEYTSGHPLLHKEIAMILWKERNYRKSRYHFLHSEAGEAFAMMLIEYCTSEGLPGEADLFVAQAVLQILCLKNTKTATVVFYKYTDNHPDIEHGPPFVRPLLNFLWFLLLAIEMGKLTVFSVLCELYQPSLSRSPSYNEYLDRIGQLFFGLPPPPSSSSGLGGLIQSILGGGGKDHDEEEPMEAAIASSLNTHMIDEEVE